MKRLTIASAAIAVGASLLLAPLPASASQQTAPALSAEFSATATGGSVATVTISDLAEPTTSEWTVVGPLAPISGTCSQVNWWGAPVFEVGSRVVSNGTHTINTGQLAAAGCYSIAVTLFATASSSSVTTPYGVPFSTVLFDGVQSPTLIGESRLSLTTGPYGLLQQTGEVYFAHSEARNVAVSPNFIDLSMWRIFEVRPGVYRLINKATGDALQATGEANAFGGVNVVTTPASWNSPEQEWKIRQSGTGFNRTIGIYNVVSGKQLGSTGQVYTTSGTYVTQANASGRWIAATISAQFPVEGTP